MARPLVSLTLALATATLLFLSMGATPASAQQSTPPAAPKPNQLVPELVDAVQLLREGKISEAIKKLEDTSRK